ncbi:hypothetical protein RDWZM_009294 [Blomia tropicalis]|uniref:Uncharacterized protein n=1 Tax=Blomia tropicalis TaxID=40697 RepID=A0A9Q0M3B7_BLOTA|nr:hypothetical protein RDWZM_009294 [Blomia tropicalis]
MFDSVCILYCTKKEIRDIVAASHHLSSNTKDLVASTKDVDDDDGSNNQCLQLRHIQYITGKSLCQSSRRNLQTTTESCRKSGFL